MYAQLFMELHLCFNIDAFINHVTNVMTEVAYMYSIFALLFYRLYWFTS